ncbi:MAG: hypothetical protein OXT67_01720 [Zetaproteobacteria bacterium]|nr:hypothetical protein [Zetaproteobacteria bacterium]
MHILLVQCRVFFVITLVAVLCFPVPRALAETLEDEEQGKGETQEVSMHFPDGVKVADLVRHLATQMGKNVIMEKDIPAQVRVLAPEPVSLEDAWEILLSILNFQKLTTLEAGPVLKILPLADALKSLPSVVAAKEAIPDSDRMVSYLYKPKNAQLKDLKRVLSKILNFNAIKELPSSNSFVLLTTGSRLQKLIAILDMLDLQEDGATLEIFELRHITGEYGLGLLRQLIQEQLRSNDRRRPVARHLADTKMLPVDTYKVALWGRPAERQLLKDYLRKFDVLPVSEDILGNSMYSVYPLQYADATKLAATIGSVVEKSPVKNRFRVRGRGKSNQGPQDFLVTADPQTNSLLVRGKYHSQEVVRHLIRQLDVRKNLILFDVQILQTSLNYEYRSQGSTIIPTQGKVNTITSWEGGALGPITTSSLSGNLSPSADDASAAVGALGRDFSVAALSGNGVQIGGLGTITPAALISLLKADTSNLEISSPQIVSIENEEAQLGVGQTVFLSVIKQDENGNNIRSVEKENVDFNLVLKPGQVRGSYFSLTLEIDSHQIDGFDTNQLPITSKRKMKTELTLKDGQTFFVGGLNNTIQEKQNRKVPFLADVPILGQLFRYRSQVSRQMKLLVFATAYVIHNDDQLHSLSVKDFREKKDKFGLGKL